MVGCQREQGYSQYTINNFGKNKYGVTMRKTVNNYSDSQTYTFPEGFRIKTIDDNGNWEIEADN